MGFFTSKQFESLEDLFVEQIKDLYDAEMRIAKALPKMSNASEMKSLKVAFTDHLRETEVHIDRLERIFGMLGREPRRESCEGIRGLLSEGSEMMSAHGDSGARDAAIISAAQRVEHYEMAGYGTARSLAEHLGHDDAARLLQSTLDEEMATDKKLTELAEAGIYGKKPETSRSARRSSGNGHSKGNGRDVGQTKTKSKATKSQRSHVKGNGSARRVTKKSAARGKSAKASTKKSSRKSAGKKRATARRS